MRRNDSNTAHQTTLELVLSLTARGRRSTRERCEIDSPCIPAVTRSRGTDARHVTSLSCDNLFTQELPVSTNYSGSISEDSSMFNAVTMNIVKMKRYHEMVTILNRLINSLITTLYKSNCRKHSRLTIPDRATIEEQSQHDYGKCL